MDRTTHTGGADMRVMVFVRANKDTEAGVLPSTEQLTEMGRFNEELARAGIILAAEGLQPTSKGARVRFSGNKRTVVDGPFAETRELIHGRLGTRIWQTAWLLIGPVLAFLYLGFVGLRNLHPTAHSALDIQLGTAATFIGLFVVSLRNSWNLLVEVSPIAEAGPP